jgi:SAM-dependent methyltransferase
MVFETSHTAVESRLLDIALPAQATVLEAGCGRTTRLIQRRDRIRSLVGVDLDVEAGRQNTALDSFLVADLCEQLPFADASFDVVLSTFGVMFTPDQDRAASELLRVCKSGGKIGLANWTPEGFIGQLFKTLGKYLPPPAGAKSPALWGTQARITEMFGAAAVSIKAERRHFTFRYRSPMHFLDVFRNYYGPTLKAFAALDETNQRRLADDILTLIASMNRAEDGTMVLPSEYLEIVIVKR